MMERQGLFFWTAIVISAISFQIANGIPVVKDERTKRETSSMQLISDLAQQFFNRGGQQGVTDLNNANSDSKMGVLQRYLGNALIGAVVGGNTQNDLVSRIISSFTGSGGGQTTNNNNRGTGNWGSNTGNNNNGDLEPLPGSSSKTGVAIINSRPSDRARTQAPDYDSSYNRDTGSSNNNNRDRYNPSSSGGNSRSGVSVVDSRPGDRRGSNNNGDNENDTESVNGDVGEFDTSNNNGDGARSRWGSGSSGGAGRSRDSQSSSYGRGNSRGNGDTYGGGNTGRGSSGRNSNPVDSNTDY